MFNDQAMIFVQGGKGGDGASSFRREAMVARGGPDGGSGGRGGSVILVVNPHMNTLGNFQHKRRYEAEDGRNGGGKDMTGRSGRHTYIDVPPGTLVRDAETKQILGDLTQLEQQLVVVKGGRGGRGNGLLATSTNQAPTFAENGAPGETRSLTLELKLIADIGIVGLPNAGKSTLISVLTAAKPKIADYPFTTLSPNLGVASIASDRAVVLADIPGLIEGASSGVGLGHDFLRHIERTRILIHLIDGLSDDPFKDYDTIQAELRAFGHGLIDKPQVVGLTKMDQPDARAAFELYVGEGKMVDDTHRAMDNIDPSTGAHSRLAGQPLQVIPISSATGEGVRPLLNRAAQMLDLLPPVVTSEAEPIIELTPTQDLSFDIVREGRGYRVVSPMLERKVQMTRWDLDDAVLAFQRTLQRSGIGPALERAGVQTGDIVYIGDYELEWGV